METRIEKVRTTFGTVENTVMADEEKGIFISVNWLTKKWMRIICSITGGDMPEIVNGCFYFEYPEYLSSNIYPYNEKKYREQLLGKGNDLTEKELEKDYWISMVDYISDDVPAYYEEYDRRLYFYLYNESLRGAGLRELF